MNKTCYKCKEEKDLKQYSKNIHMKNKYKKKCKSCDKKYQEIYRSINEIKQRKKELNHNYRQNNLYKIKEYEKQYRIDNKDKIQKYLYSYTRKSYNKEKRNISLKERRSKDIQYKLQVALRTRQNSAIKGKAAWGSAVSDLGCSIQHLKLHLELFWDEEMTWDNYGNKEGQWSIDHIIPLSSVDLSNKQQYLLVSNYKNLQPLWHVDNLRKQNKVEKEKL